MSHSFAAVWLHIVFSAKNRLPFLHDSIRPELHACVATVLKNLDCPALLINCAGMRSRLILSPYGRLNRSERLMSPQSGLGERESTELLDAAQFPMLTHGVILGRPSG